MISYIKTELMKEKRSANLKLGIIVPIIFVLFNVAMVSLMGESPEGKSMCTEDLKKVGAIIEHPAIYPNLTAYENLEVLTVLLNIDKRRIDYVLKIVGLENTNKKLARNFSLGMKQRLGIAMALINNPELLILDEPTNGLDPLGIQELRELIKEFSKKGITVIISSHILSEIKQIADKIGVINNGHLIYEANNSDEMDLEKLFLEVIKKDVKNND